MRERIYNNAITELTRSLLERRSELARQVSLASLIAAPDTEKGARFPVHPGATAYLSDTDTTWFTLLSDQIWNVLLVGGMLSSISAAMAAFLKQDKADPLREHLDRLASITERAWASADPGEADPLAHELSTVAIETAALGYERRGSSEQFAAVQLAFGNARDAVQALRAKPGASARSGIAAE